MTISDTMCCNLSLAFLPVSRSWRVNAIETSAWAFPVVHSLASHRRMHMIANSDEAINLALMEPVLAKYSSQKGALIPILQQVQNLHYTVLYLGPAEFKDFVHKETEHYTQIATKVGVRK